MEGTFWGVVLLLAPLWSWVPLGIAALILWLAEASWHLWTIPVWCWSLTWAPYLYARLSSR